MRGKRREKEGRGGHSIIFCDRRGRGRGGRARLDISDIFQYTKQAAKQASSLFSPDCPPPFPPPPSFFPRREKEEKRKKIQAVFLPFYAPYLASFYSPGGVRSDSRVLYALLFASREGGKTGQLSVAYFPPDMPSPFPVWECHVRVFSSLPN